MCKCDNDQCGNNCSEGCGIAPEYGDYAMRMCGVCIHEDVCKFIDLMTGIKQSTPIDPSGADCRKFLQKNTSEDAVECDDTPVDDVPMIARRLGEPLLYNAITANTAILIEHGYKPIALIMNEKTIRRLVDELGIGGMHALPCSISFKTGVFSIVLNEDIRDSIFLISCTR